MAIASTALRLRRLRQRFGIGAPKVAIRAHIAWHWRVLATLSILLVFLASVLWIYDAGRRIAGFQREESSEEIRLLQARLAGLDDELRKLRSIAGSGESNMQIERATQQKLVQQVKALESENANLKQDLAFFEGLIPATGSGGALGVQINRLRVETQGIAGQYQYRMLLVHNSGRQAKDFKGELQLVVQMRQLGKDVMMVLPAQADTDRQKFNIEIKRFQRAEGMFSIPTDAVVKSVEVRVLQDGVVRARQSVTL